MPDHLITLLITFLLIALLLLVLMVWIAVTRVLARLRKIENLLGGGVVEEAEAAKPSRKELRRLARSEFEQFLEEDGKRRLLKKSEQSAAFREWRRQRGLTWKTEKSQD